MIPLPFHDTFSFGGSSRIEEYTPRLARAATVAPDPRPNVPIHTESGFGTTLPPLPPAQLPSTLAPPLPWLYGVLVRVPGAKIPLPLGFIPPCLPRPSQKAPSGSAWVHEIKHDGYRLVARKDDKRVRLYTRRGYNQSIIVDGEAVWAGKDGRSDFDKLHSGGFDEQVILYGFDLLELNGDDYRQHPLEARKAKLAKILTRSRGIIFSEHLDADGEIIFEHACCMGLEGIVSKRRDFAYRSGRCKSWVKINNPASPTVLRIQNGSW
jgi:bifunctional non-homologous end joining protein LigD